MAEVQKDDQLGNREDTVLFVLVVQMFAQQAMMQLGKIANPVTHKAERDLEAAGLSIGILEMLEEKTRNNLSQEEGRLLKNILTDLRLNYVEEVQRAETETKSSPAAPPHPTAASDAPTAEAPAPEASGTSNVKFHKKYE